jgi:hypothetical protein
MTLRLSVACGAMVRPDVEEGTPNKVRNAVSPS